MRISSSEKTAVYSRQNCKTYSELIMMAEMLSRKIKSGLSEVPDYAAVIWRHNTDFPAVVLALWHLGITAVPLSSRLLPDETERILEDNGINTLIIDPEYSEKYNFKVTNRIIPHVDSLHKEGKCPACFEFDNNKNAVVIFTSGSTRKPKGVVHTFGSLQSSAEAANEVFNMQPDDRWLASLPFYHIGGFSIITRSFIAGTMMLVPESPSDIDVAEAMDELRPTHMSLVSTVLKRLTDKGIKPHPELRCVLLGGGPLSDELVMNAKGWNIFKSYGASETCSLVAALNQEETTKRPGSSGKALSGNKFYILNEEGEELPAGKEGLIAVSADSLMKGYLNNEKLTSEVLRKGMYYTGDYGYLDEEGYIYILERRSDLIITGGENVSPTEVEEAIMNSGLAEDVCVFALSDKTWGQAVAAAIIKKEALQLTEKKTEEKLNEYLRAVLSHYKIPSKYFFTDKLPRTELGKLKRSFISAQFQEGMNPAAKA
jgi:O-succinylbenzoic acid--CoA ligase